LIWSSSCGHLECYSVVVSLYEGEVLGGGGVSSIKSPACCFEWRGRGILREKKRVLSLGMIYSFFKKFERGLGSVCLSTNPQLTILYFSPLPFRERGLGGEGI